MKKIKDRIIKCRIDNTCETPTNKEVEMYYCPSDWKKEMNIHGVDMKNKDAVYRFFIDTFNKRLKEQTGITLPVSIENHSDPNCTIEFINIGWWIDIYAFKVTFHTKTLDELYAEREKISEEIKHLLNKKTR